MTAKDFLQCIVFLVVISSVLAGVVILIRRQGRIMHSRLTRGERLIRADYALFGGHSVDHRGHLVLSMFFSPLTAWAA